MKCAKMIFGIFAVFGVVLMGCGGAQKTNLNPSANEKTASNIPEWYLEPPEEGKFLFYPSSANSRDMQLAVDKATHNARLGITQVMENKSSALISSFQAEAGIDDESDLENTFSVVAKSFASQALIGVQVKKRDVQVEKGIYRAYVLMSLPIGKANRQLMDKIKENSDLYKRFRETDAFEKLDEAIKAHEAK
jgi:hypothetical protein